MGCIKSSLLFFFIAAWIGSSQSLLQYCTYCKEWDENNALCVYCCDNIYECCSNPGKNSEDCKLLPCPCGSQKETTATTTPTTTSATTTPTTTTSTTPATTTTSTTIPTTTTSTTPATTTTATTTTATTTTATTTTPKTTTATTTGATAGSTDSNDEAETEQSIASTTSTAAATTPAEPRKCTFPEKSEARILGGAPTTVCERPWMVRIVLVVSLGALMPSMPPPPPIEWTLCNAVLISETQILTSKFCAEMITNSTNDPTSPLSVKVHFGDTNITAVEDQQLMRKIKGDFKIIDDIAVGTLNLPVVARDILCTRPVCLPDNSTVFTEDKNQECKIAAWGGTEEGGVPAPVINEANVTLMPSDHCKTTLTILEALGYKGVEIPPDDALCTSAPGLSGTCQGDEGGVLLCKDQGETTQDNWILAGLALSTPCNENLPSTFINVAKYVKDFSLPVPGE